MQSQSQLPTISVSVTYNLNSARARLARVSDRLGLAWLDSHLGSGSFFSENESLGSASTISVLFTPLNEIYIIIH